MADTITAGPYEARLCRVCGEWVHTAAGPFAEGDPTKTLADLYHYEDEHGPVEGFGIPYMPFNEEPVTAVRVAERANQPRHLTAGDVVAYFSNLPTNEPVRIDEFINLHAHITEDGGS